MTNSLESLRQQLQQTKTWPLKYMFKFIVPNSGGKVDLIISMLPKHGANTFKPSKDLHYVAVTCVATMQSADEIIDITARASSVEGVLSL